MIIKKIGMWLGAIVAAGALIANMVGFFILERENDGMMHTNMELRRENSAIRLDMAKMETRLQGLIKDKELACAVLEATITNGNYSHTYLKGDKCENQPRGGR